VQLTVSPQIQSYVVGADASRFWQMGPRPHIFPEARQYMPDPEPQTLFPQVQANEFSVEPSTEVHFGALTQRQELLVEHGVVLSLLEFICSWFLEFS
jgi:hypothetical protein